MSISNATELGTVYTPDEVRALAELAHERGMLLHLDGARLANAAACLDVPLRALTTDAGVDVVSFGGTKNGLLLGEAVVFLDPELADDFEYLRKQSLQLASKMRFVAAQFDALLRDDLWLRNAAHANAMAARLATRRQGDPRRPRSPSTSSPTPSSRSFRRAATRAPARRVARRAPVPRVERGDRRGPLDDRLGHDRGGRRPLRRRDCRRACAGRLR